MTVIYILIITILIILLASIIPIIQYFILKNNNPPPMIEHKDTFHDEVGEMIDWHKAQKESHTYQIIEGEGIDN